MQNQYENSLEILILKSDISRYEDNIKCSADGNIKALKSLLTEVRVQLGVQNSNFRQKLSPYLLGKSISTTISLLSAAYLTYSSCISNRNALSIFL